VCAIPDANWLKVEDPRLELAIVRPWLTQHGETFLAYYLPEDDESATRLKTSRVEGQGLHAPSEVSHPLTSTFICSDLI
jgi:hypothetical protein